MDIHSKEKRSDMLQCAVKIIIFGLSGFFGIGAFTNSFLNNDVFAVVAGIFGGIIAVILVLKLEGHSKPKMT